ncbi:DUF1269 domain-containing protein [Nocardioides sp. YIM 152315]|uniref:DUF1269 domain-containing protein n=1 Tax=Nocardioides sp. YIM 152315 TaxID=3031760 RepID=UPI0023DCD2EF|nr:DUF1269 domain-containing protein [Nocardioides sp. YIM 152315]MDF1604544.1 DUF1269 domain-containing protein [Nocardioides sp. YIM 152315]
MATLAAWRFATAGGAARASVALGGLREEWLVPTDSALVEWRAGQRRPHTRRLTPDDAGALGDGFWSLLFGLTFFLPLLGAAVGASTGSAAGSLADVGIDDHFLNRVRDHVTPGSSALFVLGPDAAVDQVRGALGGTPRSVLITTHLDAAHVDALRAVFGT